MRSAGIGDGESTSMIGDGVASIRESYSHSSPSQFGGGGGIS